MHALLHERVCDRQPRLGGVDPRTRICGTPRPVTREYNQVPCLTEDRGLRARRSSDRFVFITSLVSLAEAREGLAAAKAGGKRLVAWLRVVVRLGYHKLLAPPPPAARAV
eukprot:scaffold63410_cov70-Phaeocystis_antarctica.AAC.1